MENVATRQFLTSGTRHFLLACLRTADIVTQFFTSFSLSVVSDQCTTSLGKANVRYGEGGIPSEVAAQVSFPVTLNDGFQNVPPSVGAVDVAGAQGASFQIAELVE